MLPQCQTGWTPLEVPRAKSVADHELSGTLRFSIVIYGCKKPSNNKQAGRPPKTTNKTNKRDSKD
jgi:hypothetical protein